jgi:cytoskeletal protein CcmA (bactofilin family)
MFDRNKPGAGRPVEPEARESVETERRVGTPAPAPAPARAHQGRDAAVIGPSIQIDGDLRGQEDLVIEGTVNGTIHLEDYSLTIGGSGKVKAEVYADNIMVDGTVEGDLYGAERIAIRRSGNVQGNVVSPRISLEDGGRVKGSIEMDQQAVDSAFGSRRAPAAPPATPKTTAAPAADKGREAAPARSGTGPGQGEKQSAAG